MIVGRVRVGVRKYGKKDSVSTLLPPPYAPLPPMYGASALIPYLLFYFSFTKQFTSQMGNEEKRSRRRKRERTQKRKKE